MVGIKAIKRALVTILKASIESPYRESVNKCKDNQKLNMKKSK